MPCARAVVVIVSGGLGFVDGEDEPPPQPMAMTGMRTQMRSGYGQNFRMRGAGLFMLSRALRERNSLCMDFL